MSTKALRLCVALLCPGAVGFAFQMDASILRTPKIGERIPTQFGVEAFNLLNHNYFGRDQVNQDPTNPNFGTIFPATVSTQNILPRQLQIRMKVWW